MRGATARWPPRGLPPGFGSAWAALPLGLWLGLAALGSGCTVPAPTVRQGLDYGFRTPEQAFRSWRTAIQGDLLVEEYKTLSKGWVDRNNVSLLTYAEVRDEVHERFPQLRWALYRAKEPEAVVLDERLAILQSRIPGPLWFADRWLVVRLVREGFWDLWVEGDPLLPTYGYPVQDLHGKFLRYDPKSSNLWAVVPVEAGREDWPTAVHLMQVGLEWKIDDFQVLDEPLDPNQPYYGN